MAIIKIILYAMVIIAGIMFFTLFRNGANLFQDPGFSQRFSIFLTTNQAVTADDHRFKELQTPVFNVGAEKLYQQVLLAASQLGWEISAHDSDNQNARFIVNSPMFLLQDDVYVQVKAIDEKRSSLYMQSSSRSGQADFAANSGHIQKLIAALKKLNTPSM